MNKNTHGIAKRFLLEAKKKKRKVGIVLFKIDSDIIRHLRLVSKIVDLIVIGSKVPGIESIPITNPEEAGQKVIEMLDKKEIDTLVRGQLHPRPLMLPLCQREGNELGYFDGTKRINPAFFENKKTKRFFLFSGIDLMSGINFEQKRLEVLKQVEYLKSISITPFVGLMTMRRGKPQNAKLIIGLESIPIIEETYKWMEKILKELQKRKIKAEMFNIEYETAVKAGVNLILPPFGPIGNAFGRSLTFFSTDWELVSLQALQFRPLMIEDGFKTMEGKHVFNHIISAAANVNMLKK